MAIVISPSEDILHISSEIHYAPEDSDLMSSEFDSFAAIDFNHDVTVELIEQGIGGSYFIKNRDTVLGIFKPAEEEPGMPGNPKGQFKPVEGVEPGRGAVREIVAYELDHYGFAKVPKTFAFEYQMKKGSFQEFVPNVGTAEDFGSGLFSVENVQKLAQFDIRILNMDRNTGNMLVTQDNDGSHKIVPIDHSYILPESLGRVGFDWMFWRQVKGKVCDSVLRYVERIDLKEDEKILRKFGVEEISIRNMKLATMVLKRGCKVGWSLFKIAEFLVRDRNELSPLESVIKMLEKESGVEFWKKVEEELERRIN